MALFVFLSVFFHVCLRFTSQSPVLVAERDQYHQNEACSTPVRTERRIPHSLHQTRGLILVKGLVLEPGIGMIWDVLVSLVESWLCVLIAYVIISVEKKLCECWLKLFLGQFFLFMLAKKINLAMLWLQYGNTVFFT